MEWSTVQHLDLRHVGRSSKPFQPHAAVFHPSQALVAVAIRTYIIEFDAYTGSKNSSVNIGAAVVCLSSSIGSIAMVIVQVPMTVVGVLLMEMSGRRALLMAAVAHSFGKSINVYDQDIHLRTFCTLWYPTSLSFISNLYSGNESSILAVTEGCQLAIWDLRLKENGGCVQRVTGSVGDILYVVCNSSDGYIAVGGADRTVTIYDPRRQGTIVDRIDYNIQNVAVAVDEGLKQLQKAERTQKRGGMIMCATILVIM